MRFEVWSTIYVMMTAMATLIHKTYDYGVVYTIDNLPPKDGNLFDSVELIEQFLSINETHYDKLVSCLASKTLSEDAFLIKQYLGVVTLEVFVLDCSGKDAVTGKDHCRGNQSEYESCFLQAGINVDACATEGSSDEDMIDFVNCRLEQSVKLDEEGFFKVFNGVTGSGIHDFSFRESDDATEISSEEIRFLLYGE